MGAIAKAVNAFNAEAVQHEAFSALIAAFHGRHHSPAQHALKPETDDLPAVVDAEAIGPTQQRVATATSRRGGKSTRSDWKMIKDLDLNPKSKTSFDDFISEKKPKSFEDRYAVTVCYLSEILDKVTIDHIGTVFRLTKSWKEPTDLAAGLRMASSRKGTIDTSSYQDVKITPAGRNLVEHDLPPKEKAKK
jgi:hypothetical protein